MSAETLASRFHIADSENGLETPFPVNGPNKSDVLHSVLNGNTPGSLSDDARKDVFQAIVYPVIGD